MATATRELAMTAGAQGPIVIAAGGTGGHVFPALALARGLRSAGLTTAFVTDRRGTAFGGDLADVPCHKVRAGGLAGRGISGMLRGMFNLLIGTLQARSLLRRLAPSLAVGFGGYASVPPLLAARSLGIPTLVHEANAVLVCARPTNGA
jgi:UDP-N-acetylglucosamine--N-acetylmuramyl-(pentapeptide) pyrophosphoryl-undecaprenol N-acetylglucosamine transferase